MGYLIHPTCQIPGLSDIYTKVFGENFTGTFVEVGAFDGMTYSNTWGLAERGWVGMYIEPHPDFAKRCEEVHAKNKVWVREVACGASGKMVPLTIYGEVSTTLLDRWNRDWGMDESTPTVMVEMDTFDCIYGSIVGFDLLVIDVEGIELEVLKGLTISRYMPRMVIIELHEGQGTGPDQKGWQTPEADRYFFGAGYRKIYADNINTIYAI